MKKLFSILFALTLAFQVNAQEATEAATTPPPPAKTSCTHADKQSEAKKPCCKKSDEAKSSCKRSNVKKACCKKSDEAKSSCKHSDAKKACCKNGGDKAAKSNQDVEKAHTCTPDCATSGDCPHKH